MVKKLLCSLLNASSEINGIEFEPYEFGGMVSVDPVDKLDQSAVHRFLKVGGYKLIEVDKDPGKQDGEKVIDESTSDLPASQSVLVNKPHKKTGRSKDKEIVNE